MSITILLNVVAVVLAAVVIRLNVLAGRRAREAELDAATAEYHVVDGVKYLCHRDDHYCGRESA